MTIRLYRSHEIKDCQWPKNEESHFIQKTFIPLLEHGISRYIDNVHTDLGILIAGECVFPITINSSEYENSYVCSPYSYYISYAQESLHAIATPFMQKTLRGILWGASKILRHCQFNQVVVVNNWFTSTTLYPPIEGATLQKIISFLQKEFPHHTILFRSIDPHMSTFYYTQLQTMGFEYVASRQVFFIDPHQSTLFESRLFKSDVKLLRNSGYEIIEREQLLQEDMARLADLYKQVFIDKYSRLNPMWNQNYVRLALSDELLHFKGLKKNGRVDGIVGYVIRHGKMFCSLFGYDQTISQETGLYRLLSTVLMLNAHEKKVRFHLSSGASMFKKIRKAEECIEYTAVFHKHLPFKRRIPWVILKKLCNSLGKKYMKKY